MVLREIAVVGMACRAPESATYEDFWANLVRGAETVTEWPSERRGLSRLWSTSSDLEAISPADLLRAMKGGFLTGVDMFDARLFGISPREARLMDPQHRMLLEESWQALLDAAIDPRSLEGSNTGVFFGLCSHDYSLIGHEMPDRVGPYSALGGAQCIASNRVSFALGLRGPSLTVDAACAASAMGIHLAAQALLNGECDVALAGGVNLVLVPVVNVSFEMAHMLSAAGRCATFDKAADGYVRSEAAGIVVLKRLEDARDDPVHAVIAASAANQDGRTSSITVPSAEAQYALIRRCHDKAGIDAEEIAFVEAHGTGTPVGDPVEAESLARVFEGRRTPCYVGSLKANFGHAEAAAGVLSVIKTVLALERECLPPHVGAKDPIAPFDEGSPIVLPAKEIPLVAANGKPLFAGVSAFGFGGTNVHLVLRSHLQRKAPQRRKAPVDQREAGPFVISAHTEEALGHARDQWLAYLGTASQTDFDRILPMSQRAFAGERFRIEVPASSPQAATGTLGSAPVIDSAEAGARHPEAVAAYRRPAAAAVPYPFARRRFWAYDYSRPPAANAPVHDFPDELPLDFSADYITNHRIAGAVIVPGATIMMAVRGALLPFTRGDELEIRDMQFRSALIIDPAAPVASSGALVRLSLQDDGAYRFALHRRADDVVCADGLVIRKAR